MAYQRIMATKLRLVTRIGAIFEQQRSASNRNILRNPYACKGLAFTGAERTALGLKGLLPPAVRTLEQEMEAVLRNLARCGSSLDQYLYLRELQDANEPLFYRAMGEYVEKLLPLVYTPTVGEACQQYSLLFRRPKGLFISIKDKGRVAKVLDNWPENDVRAVCVTDGERILGLGDLGANGMGIPVGKLALYTALAGVPPHACLPVTLDVGTNNDALQRDPLYIGLREKRVRGKEYDDFVHEFMQAVVERYGHTCLVQFEDFGNVNAFRLLERYEQKYCTFNDDIQGTAAVAVAGILASLRVTEHKLAEYIFFFMGAGEAALGIADLLTIAMTEEEGLSPEEARQRIWMMDRYGLLALGRPTGHLNAHKTLYAKEAPPLTNLEEIVALVKPSAIFGASAQAGAFNERILRSVATYSRRPIVFALSNPTSCAECTAEEAYKFTDGRCVFASGSPFPPVVYGGRTFHPGQGNNAYIFPGVALAVTACHAPRVGNELFLLAAKSIAEQVTPEHLEQGRLYPPLDTIRETSLNMAVKIAEHLFQNRVATVKEPRDKREFIKQARYKFNYEDDVL